MTTRTSATLAPYEQERMAGLHLYLEIGIALVTTSMESSCLAEWPTLTNFARISPQFASFGPASLQASQPQSYVTVLGRSSRLTW